jgi:DNA-binding SARP family transcriptional activator/tetratricopeptide (TPR) repeat protein
MPMTGEHRRHPFRAAHDNSITRRSPSGVRQRRRYRNVKESLHIWGDTSLMGSTGVIYRLLGELEVGRDGRLVDLPAGRTLVVLAALLVNANRRMSKAELIRAAWGDDNVADAQLHKRVMAVRDLLAQIGRRDDIKTHPRFGYELCAAENDSDAALFQRLVRDAEKAGTDGRAEDEVGSLWEALRLWRGPHPLSNVPSDAFYQETVALEQRRKRAAVRLFDLELARGNHEPILDQVALIAGQYPTDRRLCEQLMLAEYRCGHLADVARTYERYQEALAEETGGAPDPQLRALHFAIARGDEPAVAAAESVVAKRAGRSARPRTLVPRQLPPAPDLVGRADLVAEVSWLLRSEPGPAVPAVIISGPGGIGKTALALRAARESSDCYPDGQLYAELGGTTGGAVGTGEVLAQFLRALGAPRVPETKAERLAEYRTLLADRRVLVVLDDAASGAQVSDLVPGNPGCAVLATARQRLPDVGGGHHVAPLEPLGPADATELFLRVIADAGITLENDSGAVGRVVALCGGLPLALRIAGALRVHSHPRPTAELADRLAEQGPEAFAYGELNVARTIGAGFDRLDPAAQRLFLGLGSLPLARFGLWTAAALLGQAGPDPAAALSRLAASFMIEPVESQLRYRFHDLTKEYARRRAVASIPGDLDVMATQAYEALLTLTRRAHMALYGGDAEVVHSFVPDWTARPEVLAEVDTAPLDWFEKERPNIRAAVEHCAALGLTGACWDLAVSAHEFYSIRGYFDDWFATHTVALGACRAAGDRRGEGILVACLSQPALVASRRSEGVPDLAELRRAVDLLAGAGDRHGQAIALRTLANALRRQGHLTGPLTMFRDAFAHYEASGDTVGQWQALRFIGQTHLVLGNHQDAHRILKLAEVVATELGDPRLIAQARYWVGQACLATDDLDGAQAAFDAVYQVYRDAAGVGRAYALHGLGDLARRRGAYSTAEPRFTEATALARDGADAFLEGRVWLSTAALRQAQGRAGQQIRALEQAAAVFAGCGAAYLEAQAHAELAGVMTGRGETAAAAAAWAQVERLYDAADLPAEDRIHHRPGR